MQGSRNECGTRHLKLIEVIVVPGGSSASLTRLSSRAYGTTTTLAEEHFTLLS